MIDGEARVISILLVLTSSLEWTPDSIDSADLCAGGVVMIEELLRLQREDSARNIKMLSQKPESLVPGSSGVALGAQNGIWADGDSFGARNRV